MARGFSLVELSLVLVILGLLVGGVLSGQALIRAAELRAMTAQSEQYRATFYTFRDKYFALPGDMSNAVRFWGAQTGGTVDGYDAACVALTAAATDARTCNGDGGGMIGRNASGGTAGASHELYRFWQHLANAGLIEGQYAGVTDPSGNGADATPGFNVPRGRIGTSGFSAYFKAAITTGDTQWFDNSPAFHFFYVGGERIGNTYAPFLRPEEAWNIDRKLDDGMPATGIILSAKSTFNLIPNCTTADTPDATYNIASQNRLCAYVVKLF